MLKLFHISIDDEDQMERYLYSFFIKYGKIKSIKIGLNPSQNENDLSTSDAFSATVYFANSHAVIEAYNGCMDILNRGESLGFELDFVLLKESNLSLPNNTKTAATQQQNACANKRKCDFLALFCRPHIFPSPEFIFCNKHKNGPFYPLHSVQSHECMHHRSNLSPHDDANSHRVIAPKPPQQQQRNLNQFNKYFNYSHPQQQQQQQQQQHRQQKEVKRIEVVNEYHNHSNYRMVYKYENDWKSMRDSLSSYGINVSFIKYIRRCVNTKQNTKNKEVDKKLTTDTILWYQTTPKLASQIAENGFLFKFMTDFSELMDTSGYHFWTNANISSKQGHYHHSDERHLFQCKLRLTDKQLGYLRHNGSIIITDTRIIIPSFWIILGKK